MFKKIVCFFVFVSFPLFVLDGVQAQETIFEETEIDEEIAQEEVAQEEISRKESFNCGGDLRFRSFYRKVDENFTQNDITAHDIEQIRGRLFGAVNLFRDKVELKGQIRLPYYFGDKYTDNLNDSKVELDLAYLKLKRILDLPFEITLGKQELCYGEGFLTGDRDPFRDSIEDDPENFTAAKLTYLRDQLTVDAFYSRIFASDPEPPDNIGNHDFAGIVGRYEFTSENSVEPYLFYNDDRSRKLHNHPNNVKLWIIGCRVKGQVTENFSLKGEGCYQWGDFDTVSFARFGLGERGYRAWGGYAGGEYQFPVKFNPNLGLTIINLSGEEYPDAGDYTSFHPLFRSQRFGELHSKYSEENKRIIRTTFKCEFSEKLDFLFEWFNYHANQKPLDREGDYDGDEIDLCLNCKFNEHLSLRLFAGWFFPEDYFPGLVITRRSGEDTKEQFMGEVTFSF